eukprot:Sspe_Gene.81993::Locus_53419_Transcript_2_4_Confidence_0.333_Length_1408::g.81993::m.81993
MCFKCSLPCPQAQDHLQVSCGEVTGEMVPARMPFTLRHGLRSFAAGIGLVVVFIVLTSDPVLKIPPHCNCQVSEAPLSACPDNKHCLNIMNRCRFPLYVVVTAWSPPTVYADFNLYPGQAHQVDSIPSRVGSGRIYLYYKDPALLGQRRFGGSVPVEVPQSLVQSHAQLLEFTFGKNRLEQPFIDFDISYVDSAALPVYMNSPGAIGAGIGPRPSLPSRTCKRAYNTCPIEVLQTNCPTHLKHIDPVSNAAQCVSAHHHCLAVHRNETTKHQDMCRNIERFKPLLGSEGSRDQCPSCMLFGCVNAGEPGHISVEQCMAVNHGKCASPDDCPPKRTPEEPVVTNPYATWLTSISTNVFSFSLDDHLGNSHCTAQQLDVVACPMCS